MAGGSGGSGSRELLVALIGACAVVAAAGITARCTVNPPAEPESATAANRRAERETPAETRTSAEVRPTITESGNVLGIDFRGWSWEDTPPPLGRRRYTFEGDIAGLPPNGFVHVIVKTDKAIRAVDSRPWLVSPPADVSENHWKVEWELAETPKNPHWIAVMMADGSQPGGGGSSENPRHQGCDACGPADPEALARAGVGYSYVRVTATAPPKPRRTP